MNRLFSLKGASNPGLRIRIFCISLRNENYYNTVATKLCWCYNIVKARSERSGVDWEISIILMVLYLQTIRIKLRSLKTLNNFRDAIGLIREQMKNNLKWNVLRSFGIICAIPSHFIAFCSYSFDPLVVGLYYWPQYKNEKPCLGDRIGSNDEIYLDDILSPVLKRKFFLELRSKRTVPSLLEAPLSHLCPRSTDFLCFKELSCS